ncbi:hypothetical protein BH11MYX3_BH11MYX3_10280 [soil metagenome]
MFRESDGSRNLPALLDQVADEAIASGQALSVGDVIGPRGALTEGAAVDALYVALPVYFADSFQVYAGSGETVVFGWLVPITSEEDGFVRESGAAAFEELLMSNDPDLLDYRREGMV